MCVVHVHAPEAGNKKQVQTVQLTELGFIKPFLHTCSLQYHATASPHSKILNHALTTDIF